MKLITRHALAALTPLVFACAQHVESSARPADETGQAKAVTSKDGTRIAFDRTGRGRVVVLISGALSTRSDLARLAALLSTDFSVINFDRRGRGDSGDAAHYAVEREVEDVEALIDGAGGSARLFGHSSGAVLALEVASRRPSKVAQLALYEPPFVVDDSRPRVPANCAQHIGELVSAGRRGDAVAYFMTDAIGVPVQFVEQMRAMPMWPGMESLAHTLVYDLTLVGDTQAGKPLPTKRWAGVVMPTLVMSGGASEPWIRTSAHAVAGILPHAHERTLDGQDHSVAVMAPQVLAPVLSEFFAK